jgi:hypothetical protein
MLPAVVQGRDFDIFVVPAAVLTRHHSKRSGGAERTRLGSSKFVLVVAISDDFAFETLRQIEVVREDVARVNGIAIAVALVIDTVTRIVSPTGIVQHGGSPPSNAARLKARAPTERLLSGSSRRPTELPMQRVAGPRNQENMETRRILAGFFAYDTATSRQVVACRSPTPH